MGTFSFAVHTVPVTIQYLDRTIGSGTESATTESIRVTGHYNWPPDSIAEVAMSFALALRSDHTCSVEVDWPGLLPSAIASNNATWFEFLILARPVINVQTPEGDLIVFSYTGPPNDPEKITGFQISVMLNNAQHATALTFVYGNTPS